MASSLDLIPDEKCPPGKHRIHRSAVEQAAPARTSKCLCKTVIKFVQFATARQRHPRLGTISPKGLVTACWALNSERPYPKYRCIFASL